METNAAGTISKLGATEDKETRGKSRDMRRSLMLSCLALALASVLILTVLEMTSAQGSGNLTRITNASGPERSSVSPSLSASGARVAFASDSDFLGQGIKHMQSEIWLYDRATTTVTRITTASDSGRDSSQPSLSADGTRIAFVSDSDFLNQGLPDDQHEIWLYDTATMTVTRITTASGSDRDSGYPSLSADGTRVVFRSDSDFLGQGIPDEQHEIWLYDTTTMTVTRITTAIDSDRDSDQYPYLSADGTKVAFASDCDFLGQGVQDNQYEIWLYDTATMTVTRITTASDTARDSVQPCLSADGEILAFMSDSDFLGQGVQGGQYEIWLYDTATMTVTRITTASDTARDSREPSLSSNGVRVAFYSDSDFLGQGIPAGQREIWLYDTTAMTLTRATWAPDGSNRDSYEPDLNTDGSVLAFRSDADFLGQGIQLYQYEIWLYAESRVYLPLVMRSR